MTALDRSLRWLVLICAILTVTLRAPIARADDEATLEMARDRFKEGVGYFDKKQYDKARAAFLQAYALKPHPAVLLNLAQSELRSGHEADAAAHFKMFLRDHKGATEDERKAANDGLNAARAQLYELGVNVESGAEISVDNQTVGTSPLPEPLLLAPGEHLITAKVGEREASAKVKAVAGGSSSVSLNLSQQGPVRAAAVPAPAPSEEPAEAEPSPAEPEQSGLEGSAAEPEAAGSGRTPFYKKPVFWVGTGLTVVAFTAGAILAVSSSNSYNAADSIALQIQQYAASQMPPHETTGLCRPASPTDSGEVQARKAIYADACGKYAKNLDLGDDYKMYSTISFVAGGVFAVGTIVYVVVDSSSGSSSASIPRGPELAKGVRLLPVFGPDGASAVLSGSF
jgi:hypothetical protein